MLGVNQNPFSKILWMYIKIKFFLKPNCAAMKLRPKWIEIMKIERLYKSGICFVALLISNLLLIQNSFGQAGPVRLKGLGGYCYRDKYQRHLV